MIVKRILNFFAAAVLATAMLTSCEGWLEYEETNTQISYLTKDVEFVAESASATHLKGVYASYNSCENFFLELVGTLRDGVQDVILLDLLAPANTPLPTGTFNVGYEGDFIALSRYDVMDQATGTLYTGGCYYGEARNNYLTDYYGFLTEGEVRISLDEEGEYHIEVDAKSVTHTVKMTYEGAMNIVDKTNKPLAATELQ